MPGRRAHLLRKPVDLAGLSFLTNGGPIEGMPRLRPWLPSTSGINPSQGEFPASSLEEDVKALSVVSRCDFVACRVSKRSSATLPKMPVLLSSLLGRRHEGALGHLSDLWCLESFRARVWRSPKVSLESFQALIRHSPGDAPIASIASWKRT